MIIADTNVVSEFMRDAPNAAVMAWAEAIGPGDLTICVVSPSARWCQGQGECGS